MRGACQEDCVSQLLSLFMTSVEFCVFLSIFCVQFACGWRKFCVFTYFLHDCIT